MCPLAKVLHVILVGGNGLLRLILYPVNDLTVLGGGEGAGRTKLFACRKEGVSELF